MEPSDNSYLSSELSFEDDSINSGLASNNVFFPNNELNIETDGSNLEGTIPEFVETSRIEKIEPKKRSIVSVFDVSSYILDKLGKMSTMKLQKLVYYCQAWSLVWDERPLYSENIEAWSNGPVVPELFYFHRGRFNIDKVEIGNPSLLSPEQKNTIDGVLNFYGDKNAQWLIDLTHLERPWKESRNGLPDYVRGSSIISLDLMAEYYSSL